MRSCRVTTGKLVKRTGVSNRPRYAWLRSTRRSAQWISTTFVQSANLIAIVAVISNLHPRTECPNRGKLLDCEADSLRCGGEPAIVDTLKPSATTALRNEQLSWREVVELHIRHIVRSSSLFLCHSIVRLSRSAC